MLDTTVQLFLLFEHYLTSKTGLHTRGENITH